VNHQAGPVDEGGLLVACGSVEVTYGGVQGLFDQLGEILVLDFADDPAMRLNFTSILEEMQGARPGSRAMLSALMRECLIRVFRQLCLQDECTIPWLSGVEDPNLAPALNTMLQDPGQPHSVASLAARAHMSRSAFARRFRESMGSPPLEYLRGVRLRHAAGLLRKVPPVAVAVVARRSGFASRSQFSRAFTAHFGCTPSEFRRGPAG
jgi:transcriptional regulator GlxA family with amidase domain